MYRHGFKTFLWMSFLLMAVTHFAAFASADEFNSTTLRDVWTWDDPNENDEWSLTEEPGWLRFKVDSGQDTWTTRGLMPMLIQPAPIGDYSMETHVKIDNQMPNTYGCLIVWKGEGQWIHLELIDDGGGRNGAHCEYHPGGIRLAVANVEPDELYLKIEKKDGEWNLFYKLEEADDWTFLDKTDVQYDDPHWVGIGAKTWGANPVVADFDYFRSEELGEVPTAVEPDSKLVATWAKIKVDF